MLRAPVRVWTQTTQLVYHIVITPETKFRRTNVKMDSSATFGNLLIYFGGDCDLLACICLYARWVSSNKNNWLRIKSRVK